MHSNKQQTKPSVFISYAHEGDLSIRIKELADWLIDKGVDAITDHLFENKGAPTKGWRAWMQHNIEDVDIVLIVCTERYKNLFEKREVPDNGGRGVSWESAVVIADLYGARMTNERFHPILPDDGEYRHIPAVLSDWYNEHRFPSGNNGILSLILDKVKIPVSSFLDATAKISQGTAEKTSHRSESIVAVHPSEKYKGQQRREIQNYFKNSWLPNGPTVAILQGFPGTGKSQLALGISTNSLRILEPIEPKSESHDPTMDLLTDLAPALDYAGIPDLMMVIENGGSDKIFDALLKVIRTKRVLIIIDEYQRLFSEKETLPPNSWQSLVERLNHTQKPAGRLLLISNRAVKPSRWCEKCVTKELKGLTDMEAADFLSELLKTKNLTSKVPVERLEEIGRRLGGNPRALITLVGSLMYDSLEDLISLAPDLFSLDDVELDHDLVENFERELIERTISCMEDTLLKFMRWMSVHRRPFKKEAFAEYADSTTPTQALRKQLIDRFLLENTTSGDVFHPLAREISVTRLRENNKEWQQAHSLAANYHFRHFKALQMKGTHKITTSYSELRHHLFASGRIGELSLASENLTKFALSQITKPVQSQVPENVETLEERIALISALPDDIRPKGLEYHLALCLKHRNTDDDYQKALYHARKATGAHVYYAVWLLLIELEYTLNGVDAMIKAQDDALKYLGSGSNAFAIYYLCANILAKDNRVNDAIILLEKGIYKPGVKCLSSLINLCAKYMEAEKRFDDAIRILKKGIETPEMPERGKLYIHCASLMVKMNRTDDAISLFEEGIKIPGMSSLHSFYICLADFLVEDGKIEDAIYLLKEGLSNRNVKRPEKIYSYCAEILIKNNQVEEAVALLEEGISSKEIKNPVPLYHSIATMMEETGNADAGVKFLKHAILNTLMSSEPSIYLVCAKLLFHARHLDDAVGVLKQGLLNPKMEGKYQLYQMCADYIARQGNLTEAIELLEKGIATKTIISPEFLYLDCSKFMVKADRIGDAIDLLKQGIKAPALKNKVVIYQACAKLLDKANRTEEGIELLENAIKLPGITGLFQLYQTCAKLMIKIKHHDDAIQLLNKAIAGPKIGNLATLYQLSAEIMFATGQREKAISLLKKGLVDYPKDKNLKVYYEKIISEKG